MPTFKQRLAKSMFRAGFSQSRLAKAIGVSRGAVNHWTQGKYISPANAKAVADALGVDVDWLINGGENGKTPLENREIVAISIAQSINPVGIDICQKIERLLPEQRDEITRLVDDYTEKNLQLLTKLISSYHPDSK